MTEATNRENQLFGADRLLDSLNRHRDLPVQQLCEAIKNDVDIFQGDNPQFDDITMLALRINFLKNEDSITVTPNKNSLEAVYQFVNSRLSELDIDKKTDSRAKIVVDEIYSNIVNYSKATLSKISLNKDENTLILNFQDNGTPYNPLDAEEPDVTLSAKDRKIGGMGIYLVKNTAKEVTYSHKEGLNTLTVKLI